MLLFTFFVVFIEFTNYKTLLCEIFCAGLNSIKGSTSKLIKEIIKGCLQLKHAFLSDIKGLAIEHLAQIGKIPSLSPNGLDLIVNEPSYIYYCHF